MLLTLKSVRTNVEQSEILSSIQKGYILSELDKLECFGNNNKIENKLSFIENYVLKCEKEFIEHMKNFEEVIDGVLEIETILPQVKEEKDKVFELWRYGGSILRYRYE